MANASKKERVKKLTICTEILVKAIWFFFVLRTSCTAPHKLYSTTIVWAEQSNARLQVAGPGREGGRTHWIKQMTPCSASRQSPPPPLTLTVSTPEFGERDRWELTNGGEQGKERGLEDCHWAAGLPVSHGSMWGVKESAFGCSYSKFCEKRTFHAWSTKWSLFVKKILRMGVTFCDEFNDGN